MTTSPPDRLADLVAPLPGLVDANDTEARRFAYLRNPWVGRVVVERWTATDGDWLTLAVEAIRGGDDRPLTAHESETAADLARRVANWREVGDAELMRFVLLGAGTAAFRVFGDAPATASGHALTVSTSDPDDVLICILTGLHVAAAMLPAPPAAV